jgi:hypothetical protein
LSYAQPARKNRRRGGYHLLTETVDKLVNKPSPPPLSCCFQTEKLSCPFFTQHGVMHSPSDQP